MTLLKLVNNTGLPSERNLCYVNTELQILYSIHVIKNYFSSGLYRKNYRGRLPVCDELSRIFCTGGNIRTTAAELRKLVGKHFNRNDIMIGVQQDIEEFNGLLLAVLGNELEKVERNGGIRLLDKFVGKEQIRKKFVQFGNCRYFFVF